ncbi:MAG: type II toxin-antitoxin system PemK/MazF family toxin [Chloroflexi bacterium]|nr:type II toxin-antitoxin system PemK/MazF family toxin [Chloroflexota bacterium]
MRQQRPRRGEIWWVHTPGQPYDPHQPRLGLVISEDVRNELADDVIVVPIFSSGALGPTRVALRAGVGGVDHDSVIFCEEITTLHEDYLEEGPLGPRVADALLDQVVHAMRRAIGEVIPPRPARGRD